IHEPMLISGKRLDGPVHIEVRNPARPDELVGTVVRGTPEHVDQAVASAKAAHPAWPCGPSWSGPTCLPLHLHQSGAATSSEPSESLARLRRGRCGSMRMACTINHLAPYGGVKQSGIGRKSGIEGVREHMQSQTITTHEA